jgi:hypothetical protein
MLNYIKKNSRTIFIILLSALILSLAFINYTKHPVKDQFRNVTQVTKHWTIIDVDRNNLFVNEKKATDKTYQNLIYNSLINKVFTMSYNAGKDRYYLAIEGGPWVSQSTIYPTQGKDLGKMRKNDTYGFFTATLNVSDDNAKYNGSGSYSLNVPFKAQRTE